MPTPPPPPTDLELEILNLLWDSAAAKAPGLTARQVLAALPDKKPRAYTSVLSVMQVMEKKALITHTAEANVYRYKAAVPRQKILGSLTRRLVRRVFSGSPATAIQYLLNDRKVSPDELAQIRRLLDQHEKESMR